MYRHKKRNTVSFLAVLLVLALVITGCGSTANVVDRSYELPAVPADPPQAPGVQAPEGMDNAVPIEAHLNYIDTFELMALYAKTSPISQVRQKYEQYSPEWGFVIVDSRPVARYNEAHINGAINIPDAQFEEFAHRLPEDKDKMLIFYCGGWHCPLSPASANKAIEMGYTNVWVYQEGTDAWTEENNYYVTTPEYVATKITDDYMMGADTKPVIIIDARPYASWFQSHIPLSYPIDDSVFTKFARTFPTDKSTEIIIYCGGFFCGKSHAEARLLRSMGYTNIKVLAGGMPAWNSAGLPTFGAQAGGVSFDITGGKPNLALPPGEWQKKFNEVSNKVVVDVRTTEERAAGAIPNSVHIVDRDILANPNIILERLPADKNVTVLIHCAAGARAAGVADKFYELGYENTFYLNSAIRISSDGSFEF
ncbi:rhodanese-like domain-containing protein [Desulfuribacillus alkaliarsenatis]|uniref:Rhodanese domain-containing protein n=1 Tax=Desulfuribacillus alkaliarsenatis TaxID=766136 RepID=A0A1E5G1G0_9FIRM|nr:rhodanese-like domain-containing protein [Desulfuribacillus alkaliarsenatis]OEF96750.1 hypothetical protein BHF68_06670 [Desulfuribacillus alkaliarsenatis]